MYKVTIQTLTGNEKTIFYPGNPDYVLTDAILSLKVGSAGEFNFTVPLTNPIYNEIVDSSIITVYEDASEIWRGDIRDIKQNFDKSLAVYALEDMAWLGEESVAMVAITNETYLQRFTSALATYNSNQVVKRQFVQGLLTSVTQTATCSWKPDWEYTLLDCLRKFIADDGYLKIRRVTNAGVTTRYLDIINLEDYGNQADQTISFGENLLEFVKDIDKTNFLNVLYPYGAETDTPLYGDIMERIAGTPIQDDMSISAFGRRARTVVFDTESLATLNNLAQAYLSRYSQPRLTLEIKAVDLGNIEMVSRFHIGDSVRVIAQPFSVDQWMYITKQELDLLDISNNKIQLGDSVRVGNSLTEQLISQAEVIEEQPSATSILNEAKASALEAINGENGGAIYFISNDDGQIIEQRIVNNLDIDQATKAWRWNINGFAYMHRTYPSDPWTIGTAITMDGQIVADYITTGTLNANNVRVVGKIEATSGYIGTQNQGWNIGSKAIYNGPSSINDTSTPGMYVGADGIRTNGTHLGHSGATTLLQSGYIDSNSEVKCGVLTAGSGAFTGSLTVNSSFEIGTGSILGIIRGRFNNVNGMVIQSTPDNASFAFLHLLTNGSSANRWVPWTSASDRRLKENIRPIEADFARAFFDKVNPVSFNFIADEDKKTEYGLIAQELEEVFDDLGEDNENIVIELEGEEKYKAINYEKLVGILVPAVKDLYAQINELKEEIKILKEERNG